ncbi:glycosyltransferase [Pontixanthobacter aestiaquae]|uniref:Glycosyl transferase family 8 n=1 Tax=Pontixanthobacter aestiaquae TaxID=1509367 RepID=A0A844Z8C9_9SPHN|nr:glycosyltransferase [Pontixanthobacter aestiaquae]MDN3644820.1 glycosyltransferase [Pontixanthobacter aestiaquae]MXO84175.1 hypothetical protein [Pontixanthobacter aestiaquae]
MPTPHKISELVTVTSRDYLPGTQVMLHSFLRNNAWFDGQITILHDDLLSGDIAALAASFPSAIFTGPSAALTAAIGTLAADYPELKNRLRRFLSLEAFHPDRGGSALFCDSDLLFRSDISAMFDSDMPLIACGDRAQLVGTGRDPASMAEGDSTSAAAKFTSFNAGLMVIDGSLRTQAIWDQLLGQLNPQVWKSITSDHTDQAVFNRQFGDQVTMADPSYNYLVGHAGKLRSAIDSPMGNAKVLHFNGPSKPWNFGAHLAATAYDASFVKAVQQWFDAYAEYLSAYHFTLS